MGWNCLKRSKTRSRILCQPLGYLLYDYFKLSWRVQRPLNRRNSSFFQLEPFSSTTTARQTILQSIANQKKKVFPENQLIVKKNTLFAGFVTIQMDFRPSAIWLFIRSMQCKHNFFQRIHWKKRPPWSKKHHGSFFQKKKKVFRLNSCYLISNSLKKQAWI